MSLPIDAALPEAQLKRARAALARAKAVGEEYEGVEVATATVRARRAGQAIVDEARRRGVQAIVLARRGAVEDPRRRAAGRARRPAGRLRRGGDQVRAGQGAVPGHPHRAARLGATRSPRLLRRAPPTRPPRRDGATPARGTTTACSVESGPMSLILIVGAGRVGSSVARSMLAAGNEVSVLDEDPLSHERLDAGHGHHLGGLRRALHRRPRPGDRRAARGRHRGGRRLHRLHRRRQHEPHHRPDRRQAVRGAQGRRPRDGSRAAPSGTRSRGCTRSARRATRSRCSSARCGV